MTWIYQNVLSTANGPFFAGTIENTHLSNLWACPIVWKRPQIFCHSIENILIDKESKVQESWDQILSLMSVNDSLRCNDLQV